MRRDVSAVGANGKPNRWALTGDATDRRRRIPRHCALLLAALLASGVLTSCDWRGIANVPLPVGHGTGAGHMTIYVQMPDTLALNTNSRVRVADVWVGTVRDDQAEELDRDPDVGRRSVRAAAGQRDREDRPDQLAGHAAHRAGRAAQPVAAAVAERRHHPAEELLGLPHHRTDVGQHRGHPHRRWHPEPRRDSDRDSQCP